MFDKQLSPEKKKKKQNQNEGQSQKKFNSRQNMKNLIRKRKEIFFIAN